MPKREIEKILMALYIEASNDKSAERNLLFESVDKLMNYLRIVHGEKDSEGGL